jgi:hypothetical protein
MPGPHPFNYDANAPVVDLSKSRHDGVGCLLSEF